MISGFAAGGRDVHAFSIAPAYFVVEKGGVQRGASIAAFNRIRGDQRGVTIGIFNWARRLNGVQIGLLNYAKNKKRFKLLPFININR